MKPDWSVSEGTLQAPGLRARASDSTLCIALPRHTLANSWSFSTELRTCAVHFEVFIPNRIVSSLRSSNMALKAKYPHSELPYTPIAAKDLGQNDELAEIARRHLEATGPGSL